MALTSHLPASKDGASHLLSRMPSNPEILMLHAMVKEFHDIQLNMGSLYTDFEIFANDVRERAQEFLYVKLPSTRRKDMQTRDVPGDDLAHKF